MTYNNDIFLTIKQIVKEVCPLKMIHIYTGQVNVPSEDALTMF